MRKKDVLAFIIITTFLTPVVLADICLEGNECNPNCPEGDYDCSCQIQKGYECKKDETCKAILLKNWERSICCTEPCIKSNIEDSAKIALLEDEKKEQSFKAYIDKGEIIKYFNIEDYKDIIYISALLILFIAFIIVTLKRFTKRK